MSFSDCTTAQLNCASTDGTNRVGTVPLTRLTPNVSCAPSGSTTANGDFGLSGNWYDSAKAGQGFVFELNPVAKVLFVAWYTYAVNGQSHEASGQRCTRHANYTPGARSIPFALHETTGGRFNPSPPPPTTAQVGTGNLTFPSCSAATLTFTFTSGSNAGQAGSIALDARGADARELRLLATLQHPFLQPRKHLPDLREHVVAVRALERVHARPVPARRAVVVLGRANGLDAHIEIRRIEEQRKLTHDRGRCLLSRTRCGVLR